MRTTEQTGAGAILGAMEEGRLPRRWGRVDLTLRDALASRP